MKTISTHLVANNNGFNQSITTQKSHKYQQNDDQITGNMNRNATIAQIEYERNACEDELYRLRYGIENLLANNAQDNFNIQQQQRFRNVQNPFRTMMNNRTNLNNRKNKSWLERCSPCCRRWRRNRGNNNGMISNENTCHDIYRDRYYDIYPRRTSEPPFQSQLYGDSFVSTSPSSPSMNHTRNDLRRNIDHLIHRDPPTNKMEITSKEVNDLKYNSLILKILETKALDCLCSGYSKQNTQPQISKESSKTNQRVDESQCDSVSVTSSPSISSILSDDKSVYPRFITPQILSPPSSDIPTPNITGPTSTLVSPVDIKSSLKSNESIKPLKKESKVTIIADKTSKSNKLKKKKKPTSKHKSTSKQRKKVTSTTKKRSESKVPSKRSSTSKLRKKSSTRSPSRSKSSKKSKSKNSASARKKQTKPKSNNQMNDYAGFMLPTFMYPQSYQAVYRNRQRPLNLLLTST